MSDFRLAWRSLRSTPIVTLAAALSLALGIGANTAIFSLVHSLLRLGFEAGLGWNYAMWERLRERSQGFDGAAAWMAQRVWRSARRRAAWSGWCWRASRS